MTLEQLLLGVAHSSGGHGQIGPQAHWHSVAVCRGGRPTPVQLAHLVEHDLRDLVQQPGLHAVPAAARKRQKLTELAKNSQVGPKYCRLGISLVGMEALSDRHPGEITDASSLTENSS